MIVIQQLYYVIMLMLYYVIVCHIRLVATLKPLLVDLVKRRPPIQPITIGNIQYYTILTLSQYYTILYYAIQ